MARCKYGRVKSGERKGLCRKTPRSGRSKSKRRSRLCETYGLIQTPSGPRKACAHFRGAKPSKHLSPNWIPGSFVSGKELRAARKAAKAAMKAKKAKKAAVVAATADSGGYKILGVQPGRYAGLFKPRSQPEPELMFDY